MSGVKISSKKRNKEYERELKNLKEDKFLVKDMEEVKSKHIRK